MYGKDILCEIGNVRFEIPHKIPYLCIERYFLYNDGIIEALTSFNDILLSSIS